MQPTPQAGLSREHERTLTRLALVGSVATSLVALVLLPLLATLAFVWSLPALAPVYGGWVTIAALIAAPASFPTVHLAAHVVLVGRPPDWARSPIRWLRLSAFTVLTVGPLVWVLTHPSKLAAGGLTLTWGLGFLVVVALTTPHHDR